MQHSLFRDLSLFIHSFNSNTSSLDSILSSSGSGIARAGPVSLRGEVLEHESPSSINPSDKCVEVILFSPNFPSLEVENR